MSRNAVLSKFIKCMESIAPLSKADASWDNVGLLLESPVCKTRNVLLTIDLTEKVYDEAKERKCSIIMSYHPPWFKSAKRMTLDSPLRVLALCASEGISVYSSHSALDNIDKGTNDWIGSQVLNMASSLLNAQSKDAISRREAINTETDAGRVIRFENPIPLDHIIKSWKSIANVAHVRVALAPNHTLNSLVGSVAICVGSGSSVLLQSPTPSKKHDEGEANVIELYFTGEMSHHDILQCNWVKGASVLLTEHTNCERGFLSNQLQSRLETSLNSEVNDKNEKFNVFVSSVDKDPISIV